VAGLRASPLPSHWPLLSLPLGLYKAPIPRSTISFSFPALSLSLLCAMPPLSPSSGSCTRFTALLLLVVQDHHLSVLSLSLSRARAGPRCRAPTSDPHIAFRSPLDFHVVPSLSQVQPRSKQAPDDRIRPTPATLAAGSPELLAACHISICLTESLDRAELPSRHCLIQIQRIRTI